MSIELIRSLYNPNSPLPADLSIYKKALGDIIKFGVSSQVYYLLNKQGKLEQTPLFFQERLKEQFNESLFLNLFIKSQLEKVLDRFETSELNVIPLKGIVFAEKYFGHFGARPTSDIDLLIQSDELEKAIECVTSLGFTVEEDPIPAHFHCSFSKEIPGSQIPLTIEIHWNLLKENTANLNINEFWEQAEPMKSFTYIKELSDYHTFYMICLHGWRHNMDSLKYFIDIIQMIHYLKEKVDYSTLLTDAREHQTYKRISRTLSIVYKQFPHLHGIQPLPVKRVNLWDIAAFKKEDGYSVKNYLDYLDYQFLSYDTVKHSLMELRNWRNREVGIIKNERR